MEKKKKEKLLCLAIETKVSTCFLNLAIKRKITTYSKLSLFASKMTWKTNYCLL
jgi:hypothetical protein